MFIKQPKSNSIKGLTISWARINIDDGSPPIFKFKPGHLKEKFEEENGFTYPKPIILKETLELKHIYSLKLDQLYDTRAILILDKDLTIEATKRGFDVGSKNMYTSEWCKFFDLKHVSLKIVNDYKYNFDQDLEEDYLYAWFKAGGYHGESWLGVGLVVCQLFLCMKTRELGLLWVERETNVMDEEVLKNWFIEIKNDFEQSDINFNDAVVKYMKTAQDFCDKVELSAKDKTVHYYEDPAMELFWIKRGDIRAARNMISTNHHPKSNKQLLDTLDDKMVEKAIVKQVVNDIINMEALMVNYHLIDPFWTKGLPPVSYDLFCRWNGASRANDETEKTILEKLAGGKLKERLLEEPKTIPTTNKNHKLISDYINLRLDQEMNLFLKETKANPGRHSKDQEQ